MGVAAVLALSGCGSTSSDNATTKSTVKENQPPAQQVTASDDTYLDGLTDANKGSKKGKVRLHGSTGANFNNRYLILWETEGKDVFKIDSTMVKDNSFDFGNKEYHVGFYALSINNAKNSVGVILNPNEGDVELNIVGGRLNTGTKSVNSDENEGWYSYVPLETAHLNKVKELKKSMKDPAVKSRVTKVINAEKEKLRAAQHDLINKYPGTYLAKIMTWKQTKWQADKARYWDDIDFSDESIMRSPIINDRVQDYMITHSGGTDMGFYNAIDLIHAKSSANPDVNAFTLLVMLEGFYSSNKENQCAYIMDSYIYGEDCAEGDVGKLLKERANGVRSLQLGQIPPDFTLPFYDDSGTLSIHAEAKKNDYTLLFFWSSWCHKCEQETPEYKKLYNQYKSQGFQVIGISVDASKPAWVKAVKDKGTTWPNVSQLQAWDSPVADAYRVSATPTLFLLNKDLEIVLKPERWFQVRDYLSQNLK
jgi:peroxiredoxin